MNLYLAFLEFSSLSILSFFFFGSALTTQHLSSSSHNLTRHTEKRVEGSSTLILCNYNVPDHCGLKHPSSLLSLKHLFLLCIVDSIVRVVKPVSRPVSVVLRIKRRRWHWLRLLLQVDVGRPLLRLLLHLHLTVLLHLHGPVVGRLGEAEVVVDDARRPAGEGLLRLLGLAIVVLAVVGRLWLHYVVEVSAAGALSAVEVGGRGC